MMIRAFSTCVANTLIARLGQRDVAAARSGTPPRCRITHNLITLPRGVDPVPAASNMLGEDLATD
jgi:hypothetical protein